MFLATTRETVPLDAATHLRYLIAEKNFHRFRLEDHNYFCM